MHRLDEYRYDSVVGVSVGLGPAGRLGHEHGIEN